MFKSISDDLILKEITELKQSGKDVSRFGVCLQQCEHCKEISLIVRDAESGDEIIFCTVELADGSRMCTIFNKTHNQFEKPWLPKDEFSKIWGDEENTEESTEK
jgi:hypothetical protein